MATETPFIGEKSSCYVLNDKTLSDTSANDTTVTDIAAAESHEVFHSGEGVDFRTVSWQRATVLFVKIEFAMSILSIPEALAVLGAIGGGLSVVGWATLNTYTAVVLGDVRKTRPDCHTLADMMGTVWGRVGRELLVAQLVIAQILVCAGGIVSTSTAFNALSDHSACTAVFGLVSAILITMCSSVRTFARLGWLTWLGFVTFFIAVFVFTVAVSVQERPAAAPPTGDFELGFKAMAYPTFVAGMMMSANIFVSTSGSSMYLPVISEMRRPQDYRKAAILAGIIVGVIYLVFSMVTYRFCGQWLSTPAFGSAGMLFKKISYGIALPGLVIGVGIYQHVAAKYLFVRLLRDSKHLQANTVIHWSTWIGVNFTLGTLGYIVSEAVPILNFLLALAASLCFAPFSLIYPTVLWMYDFKDYRSGSFKQRIRFGFNALICAIGLFMVVAGTYGAAVSIRDAFTSGFIARTFDCSDNSGFARTVN